MDGVLHLDDLILPESYEVGVAGGVDLQPITCDFALDLLAEVLKDPTDVHPIEIPLQVAEDDEVIDPRVAVLVILLQNIIFFIVAQPQK